MNLNQLKIFYMAVKHGNLSTAGKKLNVTQPAVTKGIQRLQEYYDIQLLNRFGKKLVLTDAGEALFWDNFIGEMFAEASNGSAVVVSDQPLMFVSRTFNDQPAGTYGQYLGAVRISRAFGPGDSGYLIGLAGLLLRLRGRRSEVAWRPGRRTVCSNRPLTTRGEAVSGSCAISRVVWVAR